MNQLEDKTIQSLKDALKIIERRELTQGEELIARRCYKMGYEDAKKVFNEGEVKVTRV